MIRKYTKSEISAAHEKFGKLAKITMLAHNERVDENKNDRHSVKAK